MEEKLRGLAESSNFESKHLRSKQVNRFRESRCLQSFCASIIKTQRDKILHLCGGSLQRLPRNERKSFEEFLKRKRYEDREGEGEGTLRNELHEANSSSFLCPIFFILVIEEVSGFIAWTAFCAYLENASPIRVPIMHDTLQKLSSRML